MKKLKVFLFLAMFFVCFHNLKLNANSTTLSEIQDSLDTFSAHCNNLDSASLNSLFFPNYLDDGEDSVVFLADITGEIFDAIGEGGIMSMVVNTVDLLAADLAEVQFTFYLAMGSDTETDNEIFIMKKDIDNIWKLYGNQNHFEGSVYSEITADSILKLYYKLDFNDDKKVLINGVVYDTSAIEYVLVDNIGNLNFQMNGDWPNCDTHLIISSFPVSGTEYTFRLKLYNDATIYQAKVKFRKGLSVPLTVISPVAYSIGDSSGHFEWTCGDQNSLIDRVNFSIWADGAQFNFWKDLEKEGTELLTSYDTQINYTNITGHSFYITAQDDYDNRVTAQVYFYPLPGDGSIDGVFTYSTNSTNAPQLNGKKTHLLLKTLRNGQTVVFDSQPFTLSLNSENTSNVFNYSFTQLYNNWYNIEVYLDLNDNNRFDTGEPTSPLGSYQISDGNKNQTQPLSFNFENNNQPQINYFSINNNSQFTNSRTVALDFQANSIGNTYLMDTLYYRIIDNIETSAWTAYSGGSINWLLTENEGVKDLILQIRDWFGNIQQQSASITFDSAPPSVTQFELNAGNLYTTSKNIQLSISAFDNNSGLYDTLVLSGDLVNSGETQYSASKEIILTDANGVKTITAVFRDNAGNTVQISDTIILDNNGPAFTFSPITWADTTQSVNLIFNVTDYSNIKEVKLYYIEMDSAAILDNLIELTKTPSPNTSNFSETFTIPARVATAADSGFVYYYLEASDSLDNKSHYIVSGETTTAPATIAQLLKLQRIDFSAPAISIGQGAFTNAVNCTVIINQLPVSGIPLAGGRIFGDIENQIIISDTAIMSYTVSLTAENGNKTIYCEYYDVEGNTSPAGSSSIFFDNVIPAVSLKIGSSDLTNSREQFLTFTYSDSTARLDTIVIEVSSDISSVKGETFVYPVPVTLATGDGLKTVSVRVYDSAGNSAIASDTIILDQTGPTFTFTPVTWADTTSAIQIPFTVTDNYSHILGVKLYYIEMDSAAEISNTVELLIEGVASTVLAGTFTIPARIATSADSGNVYYYLGAADSWYNVKYYLLTGESSDSAASISNFIKLLRQDITPLSVNELAYADTPTKTIKSRTVSFTGTFGVSDKQNNLAVYNSETGETTLIAENSLNTAFSRDITFTADGTKTVIFTANSLLNQPPQHIIVKTFNIDITPPILNIISPANNITISSDTIIVNGRLNHTTGADTAKIILNGSTEFTVNLENDTTKFNCLVSGLIADTNTLKIIATDFVGNTTSLTLTIFYNADTSIIVFNVEIDSSAPQISLDSSVTIASVFLQSGNGAPDTAALTITTSNNASIALTLNFQDTSMPITISIKTADDTSVKNIIDSGKESVRKFGADAEYEAGLKTVRKFDFIKNGVESLNDSVAAVITFTLPAELSNKYVSVYYYDEAQNKWTALSDTQLTRNSIAQTIAASVTHFSIYGVFSAGAPVQNNTDNIVVFPNPFRPNDGNPATGQEFSGSLDAGNMTGVHISGLPSNSMIKIYTILGQLVDECAPLANQGMAIWNAKNKDGEKVASGVYLIVVDSPFGKKVKKLAIIR